MSGFNIDHLVLDPSVPDEGANVGAFVRAANGTLITHTTDGAKERLDVATGLDHLEGDAFAAGDKGVMMLAVDANGDYKPLKVNNDGELQVDVSIVSGADKAEDSTHTTGDVGAFVLSVREDILTTSTSANGDYQAFKTDSTGALWANIAKQAPAASNTSKTTIVSATNTATALPATGLTKRTSIIIQNNSKTVPVTIGFSNAITASTGAVLKAGGQLVLEVTEAVTVYGITASGTASLAIIELGYV